MAIKKLADTDAEVVPEATAPAVPAPRVDHIQAIIDDHGTYRAVADCPWFDQVAFRAGAGVSASHPGVPGWLAEGLIVRTDQPG